MRQLAYHPAITVVMWRRYARALIAARQSDDARFLFVDHDEVENNPAGVVCLAMRHVGVTPEAPEVDAHPVNSSFSGNGRRGPPRATTYWLNLLAKREVATLYPNTALSGPSTTDVLSSWLSLAPSLLAFAFYAPNPTKRFAYAMNILGGKQ
jgi:hypothetical protein